MTPEQALPWKQELVASLQAVVDRFNAHCLERNPQHQIETFDTRRIALGIQIVKPQHPSCFIELTIEPERHPALVVYRSRCRGANLQRETTDRFLILSNLGDSLLVDDIPQPLTSDDLAEMLIQSFVVPN
jgi:hypothetical protein